MSPPLTPATHRASFAIGDEKSARRVADLLEEVFFEGEAAIAAFERRAERSDLMLHMADAPDLALLCERVTNAAGAEVAASMSFNIIGAKDWAKASLADLVPVPAGRFIVHGAHDRATVPPNKLGIEIE